MIKANELRFGNWVSVGKIQSTVIGLLEDCVQLQGNAIINRFEQINPISLTPEILDKCGFVFRDGDSGNDWRIKNVKHVTLAADQSTEFKIVFVSVGGYEITQCKYLHQLQNLHYSLTDKELAISSL